LKNRMIPRQHQFSDKHEDKDHLTQNTATAWDVVVLSFRLLFKRIHFWIRPNIFSVIISIPIITAPGGKAALYHTISAGLRDPAGSEVKVRNEMKVGFHQFFWKALLLSIIKWVSLAIILGSIYFWITRPEFGLRFVSILAFYGLVLWFFTSTYLYPILTSSPDTKVIDIFQQALEIAFRKPFESLLFSIVRLLLLVFGIALLGPIMLIIPALRAIISIQGYWFIVGEVIPGFMSIEEYSISKHQNTQKGNK